MALTARDRDTGRIVLPTPGLDVECRDRDCAAAMTYVRAQTAGGITVVVAHYRHNTSSPRTCPPSGDRDQKTLWHCEWQNLARDPERVEHRHLVGDRVRIADIWTPFGWAIEVQHSAIAPATVRGREDHYSGRVLWVVDAHDEHAPVTVDQYNHPKRGPVWRVTPVPPWVAAIRGIAAFDLGDRVLVAPTGRAMRHWQAGDDLLIPEKPCQVHSRDEFADLWVNGDRVPLAAGLRTAWQQDAAEKARTARERATTTAGATSARRTAQDRPEAPYLCEFTGDRASLIHPPAAPTSGPPCVGCGRPLLLIRPGRIKCSACTKEVFL